MKIAAFTLWRIDKASSRLRSFYLFHHAERFGIKVDRPSRLTDAFSADVLHLQKLVGWRICLLAVAFRFLGRKVIYDFDDQPFGRKTALGMVANMLIASHVTTDTVTRKDYWQQRLPFKTIHVLPDILDMAPDAKFPVVGSVAPDAWKRILWVGDAANLHSVEPLIHQLALRPDIRMTVSTDPKAVEVLRLKYPWIEVIPWELDIVFNERFRQSVMVLNHGTDPDARLKSENKMVLAIAGGLIPVVSRTPAYAMLARELDAEKLIFDEIADALDIVGSIDNEWASVFFERARAHVMAQYGAVPVLERLLPLLSLTTMVAAKTGDMKELI